MSDKRDGPHRTDDMKEIDEGTMTLSLYHGEEKIGEVSFEWEVCPTCRGNGSHVNPSIDRNGIDPQRFREDPEFAEQYFGGTFDQPCSQCDGRRVVPSPSPSGEEEEAALQEFIEAKRSTQRTRDIQRQERRMAMGRKMR